MTVLNVPNYIYYTGNGGTTSFPFPYKAYATSNIKVYKITSTGTVLQTSGYSLSYSNIQNGCNVVFTSAPASGTTIYIERTLNEEQTTDIPTGGAFLESVVEGMADFCTMLIQQLSWKVKRSVKVPISSSAVDIELPGADDGKLLGWDAVGNIVNISGTSNAYITPYMLTVLAGVSTIPQLVEEAGVSTYTDIETEIAPYTATGDILYRNALGNIVPLAIPVWYTEAAQKIAQVAHYQTAAGTTTAAVIPFDDTIPQITEGAEFMSLAITPKDASNILYIETNMGLATSNTDYSTVALFKDSGASAISAIGLISYEPRLTYFKYAMVAGTTSAITFSVRSGTAGGNILYMNSNYTGTRLYGGVGFSSITITEVSA
jgi:hypothetical protein